MQHCSAGSNELVCARDGESIAVVPLAPALSSEGHGAATTALLSIEGPMTFARANELRSQVLATLSQRSASIDLDLSSVTELDSSGIQILLLLKRAADCRSQQLQLIGESSVVQRTLELLRLDLLFGAPAFVLFSEEPP